MSRIVDGSGSVDADARTADVETADAARSGAETEAGTGNVGSAGDSPGSSPTPASASDAFAALGNYVRTAVLESLAEREPQPFSALFSAAPVETSAGFAYHLRQLDERFVRKDDDGYRLTYAGRRAARAVRAGTYTARVDFDPVDLDGECPICGEDGLRASCADNDVTIACDRCGRTILTLPLPPGASGDAPEAMVESFDRHARRRLSHASGGICPECGGTMEAGIARPRDELFEGLEGDRAQVRISCPTCGCRLGCPVTLAVLDHPAVVSFYHEHDRDVRERPVWNVGQEWRETVLSTDPWCVRVSTQLDDEVLSLLVGKDLTVVETERRAA